MRLIVGNASGAERYVLAMYMARARTMHWSLALVDAITATGFCKLYQRWISRCDFQNDERQNDEQQKEK